MSRRDILWAIRGMASGLLGCSRNPNGRRGQAGDGGSLVSLASRKLPILRPR
jgi:hypothetical protein